MSGGLHCAGGVHVYIDLQTTLIDVHISLHVDVVVWCVHVYMTWHCTWVFLELVVMLGCLIPCSCEHFWSSVTLFVHVFVFIVAYVCVHLVNYISDGVWAFKLFFTLNLFNYHVDPRSSFHYAFHLFFTLNLFTAFLLSSS